MNKTDRRSGYRDSRPDESTSTCHSHELAPPVVGLRRLPGGFRFPFSQYHSDGRRKSTLLVGSGSRCDILLRERRISDVHCLLDLDPTHITLRDCSKNGTFLNGAPITRATLRAGSILTVGRTSLLAYSQESDTAEIIIPAATLEQFVHNAAEFYGSIHKAADGIGVAYSTLQGWLKYGRFAPPPGERSARGVHARRRFRGGPAGQHPGCRSRRRKIGPVIAESDSRVK